MIIIDIWFIVICLMVVAGIGFRLWQRQLPPVKIHKVTPKAASQLVGEFIASSYDGQFGYPSGLFHVESASESQVVAQEIVGRGSHFTQILKGIYVAVLAIGDSLGCIGGIIALFVAVILTPLILYAALAEVLLKYLLRSRIVTRLEGAADATTVAFTLRGPVALMVGRRLERAFHAPVLPARVAAITGVAVPEVADSGAATSGVLDAPGSGKQQAAAPDAAAAPDQVTAPDEPAPDHAAAPDAAAAPDQVTAPDQVAAPDEPAPDPGAVS